MKKGEEQQTKDFFEIRRLVSLVDYLDGEDRRFLIDTISEKIRIYEAKYQVKFEKDYNF